MTVELAGRVLALASLCIATGCATSLENAPAFGPRQATEVSARLPFLRDGVTNRAECEARLGLANWTFPEERTLVYVLTGTEGGGLRPRNNEDLEVIGLPAAPPNPQHRYELVLTFDLEDRLIRHSLIEKPGEEMGMEPP